MNLGELINAVGDDLVRQDLTAQCSAAVTMSIRHYDQKRWWFQEQTRSFTLTSSSAVYPLPSDFRAVEYVDVALTSGNFQQMIQRDFTYIRRMLEGNTPTGYPQDFAILGTDMYVAYQPNAEYHARMWYNRTLTTLTASASSIWTNDMANLVRAAAAKTVALRTLHDPDLADIFARIEFTELNSKTEENERRQMAFKAVPYV